ncbi:MAG: tol-pal system protein YbgF [Ascidiaceihabitans sp.]|jgi:tol-pal system protein YbgF|tara:strand:- start:10781 stop:11596 length:816 start_codon:yes stop_codon:yes gene_type:complete
MKYVLSVVICCALWPLGAAAQDDQTLADVRQELTVLNVEIQKLRRELSTTGTAQGGTGVGTLLDRVEGIESELQRLTGKTEELEFRIGRVVADGTNRIGDLEFRLVELEGGDIGSLGETSTLGGETQVATPAIFPIAPDINGQLATQEAADFERASEVLASGDFRAAEEQFATFNQTYPGGPLSVKADLHRGEALENQGDIRTAARAYLDAFSADQNGADAPVALLKLGTALGRLGQTQEACVTLGEVSSRFPNTDAVLQANSQMRNIGCS